MITSNPKLGYASLRIVVIRLDREYYW